MTTANVVFSGPADRVKPIYDEAIVASGQTIYPGNLILRDNSGEWINHNVALQGGDYYIADMDIIRQKKVTDALTASDTAGAFYPQNGETYNVRLAAAQTVVVGDPLTSNGDGTVKKAQTGGGDEVLFYAREDVTTTGAVGRIRARVATAGFNASA